MGHNKPTYCKIRNIKETEKDVFSQVWDKENILRPHEE